MPSKKISKTDGWNAYARRYRQGSAIPVLKRALKQITPSHDIPRVAVDLGCGPGGNALAIQAAGFEVHAVDGNAMALKILKSRLAQQQQRAKKIGINLPKAVIRRVHMSKFKFPRCGMIVAVRSLGFESEAGFKHLLKVIPRSVTRGGFIVAHFFGPQDGWVINKRVQSLSKAQAKRWLSGFEILECRESQFNSRPVVGAIKHWHDIFIVGRRR